MSPRAPSRVLRHDGDGMAWQYGFLAGWSGARVASPPWPSAPYGVHGPHEHMLISAPEISSCPIRGPPSDSARREPFIC